MRCFGYKRSPKRWTFLWNFCLWLSLWFICSPRERFNSFGVCNTSPRLHSRNCKHENYLMHSYFSFFSFGFQRPRCRRNILRCVFLLIRKKKKKFEFQTACWSSRRRRLRCLWVCRSWFLFSDFLRGLSCFSSLLLFFLLFSTVCKTIFWIF